MHPAFGHNNKNSSGDEIVVYFYRFRPEFLIGPELLYAIARPSGCLSSVCLSSVTFVCPTQALQIFGNISTALGILAILDIHGKFHGDRPKGTPSPGELNTRGVAKYSDFGPIDGYTSKTVQDRSNHADVKESKSWNS